MPLPLLEVKDLHVEFKTYEGELKVLNGVSLTVKHGEKVGLVGETGCGKSITMQSIMGILPCPPGKITRGEVMFKGQSMLRIVGNELRGIKSRGISYIPQDPMSGLNPVFKVGTQVKDVIRFNRRNSERSNGKRIRETIIDAFMKVKLPDPERISQNYPVQLSGGMQQRVLIAMALVTNPELLIADEPGTALDVSIQDQILGLLKELVLKENVSILIITHNLGVVRILADKVYVMYAGNIVEEGRTSDLFEDPRHPYTKGLLASIPKITGGGVAEGIRGRIPSYLNPPEGCRFYPRCDYAMSDCEKQKPPLFEIGQDHKAACFLYKGE
jgi:peptide/nickel transport system ATP-binding protein